MNVAVIHAHPDDELLFAGALILSHPDWRWTLISLTAGLRRFDYSLLPLALAKRGIQAVTRNLGLADTPDFDATIWDTAIGFQPVPDLVITHGGSGEYGHPHHIAVHESVHRHFPNGLDFAPEGMTIEATPDKAALFREVYGEAVYDELRADKPALIDRLFIREHFAAWQGA